MIPESKRPSALQVARAHLESISAERDLLARLLHDVVSGRKPDAVASATRPDGWTIEATLHRIDDGLGGFVLLVDRNERGLTRHVTGRVFEQWPDDLLARPTPHNVTERIAERIGLARERIWTNAEPRLIR